MGGLFGGGQTQPATFSQGGNPAPYVPQNQPAFDQSYQNLLNTLFINPSMAGSTPAQQFYPQVQGAVQNIASSPYGPGEQANMDALSQAMMATVNNMQPYAAAMQQQGRNLYQYLP